MRVHAFKLFLLLARPLQILAFVCSSFMVAPQARGNLAQLSWDIEASTERVILDVATRHSKRLTVRVLDAEGRPLRGVAVTVTVPGEGPGATLDDGRTEVTKMSDRGGRVSVRVKPTTNPGPWDLRVRADRDGETREIGVSVTNGLADRSERKALAGGTFVLMISAVLFIMTVSML